MGIVTGLVPIDEQIYFDICTHDPSTGGVSDADSTPTFSVFEEATDTPIVSGTSFTSVTAIAGTEPPRDLYLLAGGDSQGWQRREPIAAGVTMAGAGYGVRVLVVPQVE